MTDLWELSWRLWPCLALMEAGAVLAARGFMLAWRGARTPLETPGKNWTWMRGFRLAILGLAVAGAAGAWLWQLPWLLALSLVVGFEEIAGDEHRSLGAEAGVPGRHGRPEDEMSTVRRKDFEVADREAMLAFLDAQPHGHLAYVRPDGSPGLVALNFARVGETLYFHGATEGEKATSLGREPRVTFMVSDGFAIVPSYFRDPERACPATQYYKAVVVHGETRFVAELAEKAAGLQALMEKLQPEGGHRPIVDDDFYRRSLETTGVIALPLTEMTAKYKFGQNLPGRERGKVARQLAERGRSRDAETAAAMAEVCPFE